MAKCTTITVETDSLLVLRSRRWRREWCLRCGAESEMIPLSEIGVISNLLPLEVEAWIQSDDLHHIRAPDGTQLICLNSMLKRVPKQSRANETTRPKESL